MTKERTTERIRLAGSPGFQARNSYNPQAREDDIERVLEENPSMLDWPGYEKARAEILEHLAQWPLGQEDKQEESEKAVKALLLDVRVGPKLDYDRNWPRKYEHATTQWSML